LKRPSVWEWLEFIFAIVGGVSAIVAIWYRPEGGFAAGVAGLGVVAARFIQKRLEKKEREDREAFTKRVIGAVLEGLQQEYFSKVEPDDRHNHRVTLFVCQPVPAGGKQLVIFRRAGIHSSSPTTWNVDDDVQGRCEGVAGRIWFLETERTVELPDWSEDPDRKAEYAAKGFVGPAQAESLKVKSKALSGTVVRVFGRKWGVLILDSKTPGFISEAKEHVVKRYAALISRTLEEGAR
jgi:hypothetical protein